MSKAKTGALIVIEQQQLLSDFEQTGIKVDAEVTNQLLTTIFENKTPLHDGAVLIRNNRIVAATCILPLTEKNVDKKLGTRHRAAIGTSEVSDAFILVVSEESGSISMAHSGNLKRNLSESNIKEMLIKPLESIDGKKPSRRKRRQKQ